MTAAVAEPVPSGRCSLMDCAEPATGFHGSHSRVTANGWESTQTPFCAQHLALAEWLTYGCR